MRGVCRMNNCVLCRRESHELICLSCGGESSDSSCENCSVDDICVCSECYDKYLILRAIESLKDGEPFSLKEFNEKGLETGLFWKLLRSGFIKRHDFKGLKGRRYVLAGKCEEFMELNMGFSSAVKSLLRKPGTEGPPSAEDDEKGALESWDLPENRAGEKTGDRKDSNEEADTPEHYYTYLGVDKPEIGGEPVKLEDDQNPGSDSELCHGCMAELETETERCQGICRECSRTLYALESLEEILGIFKPGDEFNLKEYTSGMDDPSRTRFIAMTWILSEFNLLDYDHESGRCQLGPDERLQRFIIENVELKRFRSEPEAPEVEEDPERGELECSICGETLTVAEFQLKDGETPRCRECSRRCCAADALLRIRRLAEPGVEFTVDDIIDNEDERFGVMADIWILQDFDLIEKDPALETYRLKPDEELRAFHDTYGEGELPAESEMMRTCPVCGRTMKKSEFYSNSDGKREECRECYDKIVAWEIFKDIGKVAGKGPFQEEDLLESFDDPHLLRANIWTLQDHDLLDETPDGFILKGNPEVEELYLRYIEAEEETITAQETTGTEQPTTETLETEILREAGNEALKEESGDNGVQRKEILYINPDGENLNLMMSCIVSGNVVIETMNELRDLIPSMKKCMILRDEECFELLIEISVERQSLGSVLGALEDMKWENRVPENS
ncbi:hypothetical protein DNK57_01455 [Methanothermobacter thermautotrophicus]|uniref:Uncharacterized protein n=2 Tax=Methanothermobacter thermautotrophicus TaxID=145262 RepID=A0A842YKX3_METTF|nr:hypothetical protein [Methanothermobacter thermautotrophicus]